MVSVYSRSDAVSKPMLRAYSNIPARNRDTDARGKADTVRPYTNGSMLISTANLVYTQAHIIYARIELYDLRGDRIMCTSCPRNHFVDHPLGGVPKP